MGRDKQHRYKGVLATQAKRPLLRASQADPDNEDLKNQAHAEGLMAFAERVVALHEDCGVDPSNPQAMTHIAFTLATRHVPGFKSLFGAGKGAPRRPWKHVTRDYRVYLEMHSRMSKGMSVRQAAVYVARKSPDLGSAVAVDSRFRRIEKDLAKDKILQRRFVMVAEWHVTQRLKMVLEANILSEVEKERAEGLLRQLEAEKSHEERFALLATTYGFELRGNKLE